MIAPMTPAPDPQTEAVALAHAGRGRTRLSCPAIRDAPELAARLAARLRGDPRISTVRARAWSGSVILEHDGALAAAEARALAAEALAAARAGRGAHQGPRVEVVHGPPWRARGREAAAHPAPVGGAAANGQGAVPWHALSPADVAGRLATCPERGLTAEEARARLRRHGANLMPQEEPRAPFAVFLEQLSGVPVLMLGASAVVSLAGGAVADATATLSVVMLNAVLGYVTEGQAEGVIQSLAGGSEQEVTAIRGGVPCRIPARALVPGDVLALAHGMQAPADARIVAARRLKADEAALTGETEAVAKAAERAVERDAPLGARPTMLHAGSIVAEGEGRAIVVATGRHTVAAETALLSQSAERPRAPVEEELDRLGERLATAALGACGVFFAIGAARGYPLATILRDALALAVAAIPEGLPVVATTTMALGLKRMERRGILVRRIDTVESLGAIGVLCLDKTGTLTENRMRVVAAVAGAREAEPEDPALRPLAEAAALNNDAEAGADGPEGSSATERALLAHALALGADVAALRAARPRGETVERAPGRPWMATAHGGEAETVIVKGAPEAVLARCATIREAGGDRPLDAALRSRLLALNDALAARPTRVLAIAERPGRIADADTGEDVTGLTWLGMLALADPLRPGAKDFVATVQRAGIDTVMITGDQAATAAAIARELDLSRGQPLRIVDSAEIARLPPALLAALARRAHVFARVSPQQKLAIVQALQAEGRVVAMTGDGVNDGPALKAADVGIAMGASGADLARDVANVVIRDDELPTLVDAIAQGRAVYRNIRRALEFLVTTNLSEIAVETVEALHGPGELETPLELLWINLATDVLPGLGLALAAPDRDALDRPPRPRGEPIVPERDFRQMALDSGVISASALTSHFVGLARYGPGPQTRGMTFLSLSMGQLLYTLACQRTDRRKLRPEAIFENRPLDLAVLVSCGIAVLPFFVPGLRRLLGIAPLGPRDTAVALACAATPLGVVLARRGVDIALEEVGPGAIEENRR